MKSYPMWAMLAVTLLLPLAARAQTGLEPVDLAGKYTLQRCVEQGLARNPQMAGARAALTGSEYGRKSSLGAFGPSFNVGYGATRYGRKQEFSGIVTGSQEEWMFTANITQPVFTGFRLLSSYQKAELSQEQATAKLRQVELSLIETIQTNFLDLLKARMDVKSSQDSVARLESQLKVTNAFYDVGLKPRLDVLQAEVDLATAQQELLNARNRVDTQIARLNTLIGLPLENETDYVGELEYMPFALSLEDCLISAYKKRPDLDIGRKAVEISGQDAKITASDFYPQVNAQWNYQQTGDDPSVQGDPKSRTSQFSQWSVSANLDWTVFEWGKTYNAYRQAKENVANVASELANTRLNASFEVKSNLLALREAADRIGVARKSLQAANEGYRMAEARYQAQVGTSTEVLDAQDRVTRSEAELSAALSDYQKALASLYVSMGEKNPDLSTK